MSQTSHAATKMFGQAHRRPPSAIWSPGPAPWRDPAWSLIQRAVIITSKFTFCFAVPSPRFLRSSPRSCSQGRLRTWSRRLRSLRRPPSYSGSKICTVSSKTQPTLSQNSSEEVSARCETRRYHPEDERPRRFRRGRSEIPPPRTTPSASGARRGWPPPFLWRSGKSL